MNVSVLAQLNCEQVEVNHYLFKLPDESKGVESELDEMWSYVEKKDNPRWLWHAIDHKSGQVLASASGSRSGGVFVQLKALLEPLGITRFYTDDWGAYSRHLDQGLHEIGKQNTQKIENKHLNLRTRIKRLTRKTICFSKTAVMHGLVSGMFINRYEFGLFI